jgi:8-oxo-dGTP pyrophosphatase MutT (NUDIX family)
MSAIRKSASLVIITPTNHILYMLRPQRGAFPSMHVFPGGALDDTDPSLQYCALRETYEETGILIAPGHETEPRIPKIKYDSYNEAILKETGVEFRSVDWNNLSFMRKFSQWTTPKFEKRRFTTQFFVYKSPYQFDFSKFEPNSEVMSLEWLTPSEARSEFHNKRIKFMPPQFFLTTMIGAHGVDHTAKIHGHHSVAPAPKHVYEDGRVELELGTGHSVVLTYGPKKVIDHIELKESPLESKI